MCQQSDVLTILSCKMEEIHQTHPVLNVLLLVRHYKQQSGRYVNILYSSLNLHSADKNRLVYLTYDQYVVCPLEESDISVTVQRGQLNTDGETKQVSPHRAFLLKRPRHEPKQTEEN